MFVQASKLYILSHHVWNVSNLFIYAPYLAGRGGGGGLDSLRVGLVSLEFCTEDVFEVYAIVFVPQLTQNLDPAAFCIPHSHTLTGLGGILGLFAGEGGAGKPVVEEAALVAAAAALAEKEPRGTERDRVRTC